MKRIAAKIDKNQTEVVKQLRRAGLSVAITSQVGNGFPDLVVAHRGKTVLVELKNPDMPPSKQKLTEDEIKFMSEWKGVYLKAINVDMILKYFNII